MSTDGFVMSHGFHNIEAIHFYMDLLKSYSFSGIVYWVELKGG
jgi:hypothetical protein